MRYYSHNKYGSNGNNKHATSLSKYHLKPTVEYRLIDNSVYDLNNCLLAINTYQYPDIDGSQYGIIKINEYFIKRRGEVAGSRGVERWR